MKIQFSFLGKARQKQKYGYQNTFYRFESGRIVETAFFGPELAKTIGTDRLYILGTAGSMWDVLVENQGGELDLELMERAQEGSVTQDLLDRFEKAVSDRIGVDCRLRVITYAASAAEQANLLRDLAGWVESGDRLVFDVTHGLRHLPMVALGAAHYLERVKKVAVEEIFYGALEMATDGQAPVLRLSGLLRLLDWVQALAAYDASGNYACFGHLLEAEGLPQEYSKALVEAAHYERISDSVRARQKLSTAHNAIAALSGSPLAGLFAAELEDRLGWWRQPERGAWEAGLARRWYERGDYLRAAIYAQESVISRETDAGRINDFQARNEVRERLRDENGEMKRLFHLRNAMAHGVQTDDPQVRRALRDEQTLRATLGGLIRDLLDSGERPKC